MSFNKIKKHRLVGRTKWSCIDKVLVAEAPVYEYTAVHPLKQVRTIKKEYKFGHYVFPMSVQACIATVSRLQQQVLGEMT